MSMHSMHQEFAWQTPSLQADNYDPQPSLTPTQLKVLRGVHSGLLNKQIAFELGIAESTVKAHMTALMRKLNARNRTQVAMIAQSLRVDQFAFGQLPLAGH